MQKREAWKSLAPYSLAKTQWSQVCWSPDLNLKLEQDREYACDTPRQTTGGFI